MILKIKTSFKLKISSLIKLISFCLFIHSQIWATNNCRSSYNSTFSLPAFSQKEDVIIHTVVARLLKASKNNNIDVFDMIEKNSVLFALQKESAGIPSFIKKIKMALNQHKINEESSEKKVTEESVEKEQEEQQQIEEKVLKERNQNDQNTLLKNDIKIRTYSIERRRILPELSDEKIQNVYKLSDGSIVFEIPDSIEDLVAKQDPTTGNLVIQNKIFKGFDKPRLQGYVSLPNGSIAMYENGEARITKNYSEGGPDFLWIMKPRKSKKPMRIPIPKNGFAKKLLPLSDGRIIVIKTNFKLSIYNPGLFSTEGKFSENIDVFDRIIDPLSGGLEYTAITDGIEYSKGLVAFSLSNGMIRLMDFRKKNKPTSIGYLISKKNHLTSIELLKDGQFATSSADQVQFWTLSNNSRFPSYHVDICKSPCYVLEVRHLSDGRLVARTNFGFAILEKDGTDLFRVTEFNNSYPSFTHILIQEKGFYITNLGSVYSNQDAFLDLWRPNNLKIGQQP